MERKKCKYFDDCSAPLCPQDKESLEFGLWYPDEEICKLKTVPAWVKKQRKIAKKTDKTDLYFTYKMLCHNCSITHIGIDPNKDRDIEEKKWIKNHKIKKQLSEEEKEKIRQRFKKNI